MQQNDGHALSTDRCFIVCIVNLSAAYVYKPTAGRVALLDVAQGGLAMHVYAQESPVRTKQKH